MFFLQAIILNYTHPWTILFFLNSYTSLMFVHCYRLSYQSHSSTWLTPLISVAGRSSGDCNCCVSPGSLTDETIPTQGSAISRLLPLPGSNLAALRGCSPTRNWAPDGLSQIPGFPAGLSSALSQLTNFTSVLHWLHICNCTLSRVRGLVWLKSNVEKGRWCKREGERQSAQQRKLRRNVCWPEGLGVCLKSLVACCPHPPARNLPQCQPMGGQIPQPWLLKWKENGTSTIGYAILFNFAIDVAKVSNDCLHYWHFERGFHRVKFFERGFHRGYTAFLSQSNSLVEKAPLFFFTERGFRCFHSLRALDVPTKKVSWTKHRTTALHILTGGGLSPNSDLRSVSVLPEWDSCG